MEGSPEKPSTENGRQYALAHHPSSPPEIINLIQPPCNPQARSGRNAIDGFVTPPRLSRLNPDKPKGSKRSGNGERNEQRSCLSADERRFAERDRRLRPQGRRIAGAHRRLRDGRT